MIEWKATVLRGIDIDRFSPPNHTQCSLYENTKHISDFQLYVPLGSWEDEPDRSPKRITIK